VPLIISLLGHFGKCPKRLLPIGALLIVMPLKIAIFGALSDVPQKMATFGALSDVS
jgi:hypothetical protein